MSPRSKKPKGKRNPHAVALARLGAKKGAEATNRKLSAKQRKANATKAVNARWAGTTPGDRRQQTEKMRRVQRANLRKRKKGGQ